MQLSEGRFDIARDAVLADAVHFGFDDKSAAATHLNQMLARIADTFPTVNAQLPTELRQRMRERLARGLQALQE